jgi:ribosome biogenesis GTPase / thiamine phosphate phosphatase
VRERHASIFKLTRCADSLSIPWLFTRALRVRIGRIEVTLLELGWTSSLQRSFDELSRPDLAPARVISVLKDHYRVRAEAGECLARLSGRRSFEVATRSELPAVGDWVAIEATGANRAIIHYVLPRRTKISRKVAGREVEEQVIAANINTVFIVSALTQEFNLRRIERYLALAWDSGAQPVIVLNKADLARDVAVMAADLALIAPGAPLHIMSAAENSGLDALQPYLTAGQTVAFIGSSGVGKSTIINRLLGSEVQPTLPVREHDDRGRHSTTSRELFTLRSGGMVIDTPGMRELQLWHIEDGLGGAFDDIEQIAAGCRYRDCAHKSEPGCAVRDAMDTGLLAHGRVDNFFKLQAEQAFLDRKLDVQAAQAAKNRARKLCSDARDISRRKGWG